MSSAKVRVGPFGRRPLCNTAISRELLDGTPSKAHNFKEE